MKTPMKISIDLDWSRLLGFDQTVHTDGSTVIGAKVGSKTCLRRL
ncbi:MAG: hypothetical protein SGJ07_14355 [Rhodospirillaceae bacterium]|nr:hypothetical protein [Rhodospirillaceae bacterium]